MAADYLVASLQPLTLDGPSPYTAERFIELCRSQLSAVDADGVAAVMDESVGTGFSVRLDGGRVEHDFSEKAITAALAKRLRPDLAKIVG